MWHGRRTYMGGVRHEHGRHVHMGGVRHECMHACTAWATKRRVNALLGHANLVWPRHDCRNDLEMCLKARRGDAVVCRACMGMSVMR